VELLTFSSWRHIQGRPVTVPRAVPRVTPATTHELYAKRRQRVAEPLNLPCARWPDLGRRVPGDHPLGLYPRLRCRQAPRPRRLPHLVRPCFYRHHFDRRHAPRCRDAGPAAGEPAFSVRRVALALDGIRYPSWSDLKSRQVGQGLDVKFDPANCCACPTYVPDTHLMRCKWFSLLGK